MPTERQRSFHQIIKDSDYRIYFQLMEGVAKMVTDDIYDPRVVEEFWDEVQNALHVIRKYSVNI